jgi:hypothetical protein
VEQPAEAPASADNSTLLPNVTGDSMPQFYAEAPAEAPESPRAVAAVESEPLPPVASPERSQLVAEVAKVEALLVQMQAVGQVDQAETELAHPEIEFQPSDAASYFLQPDASTVEPESAAVPAHEPVQQETQEEAVTETAQIETELPASEDVPVQCEPEAEPEQVGLPPEMAPAELAHPGTEAWVDETSSQTSPALAQRLDDAERIHRAVEKVFDRFRPLLVAAIVREMARLD